MNTASPDQTIVSWTIENYPTCLSILTGVAACLFLAYVYTRSGSLLFLRDLIWRLFGGLQTFKDERFERLRSDLRELEYFRFEFNIPARSLAEAKRAEQWIRQKGLSVREVAKAKNYIDWGSFDTFHFKTRLFSPLALWGAFFRRVGSLS